MMTKDWNQAAERSRLGVAGSDETKQFRISQHLFCRVIVAVAYEEISLHNHNSKKCLGGFRRNSSRHKERGYFVIPRSYFLHMLRRQVLHKQLAVSRT